MGATPRFGASLRDLLPEGEAAALPSTAPRLRGEVDARSTSGEGDSPPTALSETAPHPDPLRASFARLDPASGERQKKPGGNENTKPLLLLENLVKEYPLPGATALLPKFFGPKPPVDTHQFRPSD